MFDNTQVLSGTITGRVKGEKKEWITITTTDSGFNVTTNDSELIEQMKENFADAKDVTNQKSP